MSLWGEKQRGLWDILPAHVRLMVAPFWDYEDCPTGCGCTVGTEDADRYDCACDGPCCWSPTLVLLPVCMIPDCGCDGTVHPL